MNQSLVMILGDVLPQLVMPLGVALQLGALACLLRHRFPRAASTAITLGVSIVIVFSLPLTSRWLLASLEQRYPAVTIDAAPAADVIVLLGGGLQMPSPPRPDVQLGTGGDRLLTAHRLWKAGKAPFILISSGDPGASGEEKTEADYSAELLESWGIPERAFIREGNSRTTDENATQVKRVLAEAGLNTVLLVTSANHMPRAMALFRADGIDATPIPADHWIAGRTSFWLSDFVPNAVNLGGSSIALREYLGQLWYVASGRVALSDLWPSPPATPVPVTATPAAAAGG